MDRNNIAKRMKEYESVSKTRLSKRTPVIIRIDGRAFHTFTRGFDKPFDRILMDSMQNTMKYLCENIQGCVLGYTQSDEITLVLVDYAKLNTSAWFDNEVQKMCSIAASMATMAFNKIYLDVLCDYMFEEHPDSISYRYYKARERCAMFDARVFNLPKEEVTNNIYWRQLDATRNSIQMVGQANFSHKELQNKSCNMIQDMLFTEKGINWNDFPTDCKRGSCCIKETYTDESITDENGKPVVRSRWIIDKEIPIFKGEGRDYIDKLIFI